MPRVFASLLILLICTGVLPAQEKLQQVRDEVRTEEPEESWSDCDDDDNDCCLELADACGECCGWLLCHVALAPFWWPHELIEPDGMVGGYFLPWPYAQQQPGSMWLQRLTELPAAGDEVATPWVKRWQLRLALEESNDFDGLNRVNGHLLLDSTSRLGFQTSWSYLSEKLDCGCHDDMVLGDFNLVVRFAQSERAQFRTGLGCRLLGDRCGTDWGFNFTYGADLFPAQPLVLSAQLDAGTLGEAGVFHIRGSAGLLLRRWEVYAGYDFLQIGSTALQGPIAGLRLWF